MGACCAARVAVYFEPMSSYNHDRTGTLAPELLLIVATHDHACMWCREILTI